jgi:hypothetical protein
MLKVFWKAFWPIFAAVVTLIFTTTPFAQARNPFDFSVPKRGEPRGAAQAKDQQTPHVGDILVPTKPGTEIATNTLQVPKLPTGHVPANICTEHAPHVLKTLEVTLPAIPGTQVHTRSTLLVTGVTADQTSVYGWTISDFSVQRRCEMANDIVFFIVAGPNYEDGTASDILASIQKKWNEK